MIEEKNNMEHDYNLALSMVKKYGNIRKHCLYLSLFSIAFSLLFLFKFNFLIISSSFFVLSLILFYIRKSYKFKFEMVSLILFSSMMVKECSEKGIDEVSDMIDYSEKKL